MGLFVVVCLFAVVVLVIKFGKLERFSAKSYDIVVVFPNVGGIVRNANVMYAGIPVGKAREIKLAESGALKVKLSLAIYKGYTIRKDARLVINQSGLLGDRYVDVVPQSTTAAPLKAGEQVEGTSSVDLTETIRGVVDDSRQSVSNTLEQFALAAGDVRDASKRVHSLVQNSKVEISAAASNLAQSAARLNALLEGVQRGEGTAGKLLVDPILHDEIVKLVQNWRRYGILYKEGIPRKEPEAPKLGRTPIPARPAGPSN